VQTNLQLEESDAMNKRNKLKQQKKNHQDNTNHLAELNKRMKAFAMTSQMLIRKITTNNSAQNNQQAQMQKLRDSYTSSEFVALRDECDQCNVARKSAFNAFMHGN